MSRASDDAARTARIPDVSCVGKVRFDSRELADEVARRGRRGKDHTHNRNSYKCGHCQGFHLGSNTGSINRKRRAALREARKAEIA